jgi:putative phosphoribosyl transferase
MYRDADWSDMQVRFENRRKAGQYLAGKLSDYAGRDDVLVLGLPRGGVPVAYEVAQRLGAPLDVFVVRKLGVPGHEEYAMGAIASGGVRVINQDVVRRLGIPQAIVDRVAEQERRELERRENAYRDGRPAPTIEGRTVLLVDDGLATGASMWAAVAALRQRNPAQIVVAVPTASKETCDSFRDVVDDIICAITPDPFMAVGVWYKNFSQTTDDEVRRLLRQAHERSFTAAEQGG